MKTFKTYLDEQILKQGENVLDPDFEEKKEKKDKTAIAKIEKKIEKIDTEAKQI